MPAQVATSFQRVLDGLRLTSGERPEQKEEASKEEGAGDWRRRDMWGSSAQHSRTKSSIFSVCDCARAS